MSLAYDKVNPEKSNNKDLASLHNKNNPDHLHVKRLLEEFIIAFDVCAALVKPRTGKSYLEKFFNSTRAKCKQK